MPNLTFEQWRTTREKVIVTPGSVFADWDVNCKAVMSYGGKTGENGYMEIQEYWVVDDANKEMHKIELYYLMIEKDDWISSDLEHLERKLYDWYIDEGLFDTPQEQRLRSIECDVHNFQLNGWNYMRNKYKPESGDISPGAQMELDNTLEDVLTEWVCANVDIKRWK